MPVPKRRLGATSYWGWEIMSSEACPYLISKHPLKQDKAGHHMGLFLCLSHSSIHMWRLTFQFPELFSTGTSSGSCLCKFDLNLVSTGILWRMSLKVTTVKGYKSNQPWETGEPCQQPKGASVTSGEHIGKNILLSQMPSTRLIVPYCSNPIYKDKSSQNH